MLCSLALEANWVVFPETVRLKSGASVCEESQILAALLKCDCGFCAELDWEGMNELGGTPVSCSEDLRAVGLQTFLLTSLFCTVDIGQAPCKYLVESGICNKLGIGRRCAGVHDCVSLPIPSL